MDVGKLINYTNDYEMENCKYLINSEGENDFIVFGYYLN